MTTMMCWGGPAGHCPGATWAYRWKGRIIAMGRSRRHRRFGALSVTGTAAAAAVALV
jgi:hypothetical protein